MRYLFSIMLIAPGLCFGQAGGRYSFEFTNIPINPTLVSLGGINASLVGEDVNLLFSNPALSTDTLSGMASFNYLDYFADVGLFSAICQHDFGQYGHWFFGVSHIDYGEIDSYDPTGLSLGEVSAGETVITAGRAHTLGVFTLGGALKFLRSSLAGFTASALAIDVGGVFRHPHKPFSAALVIKNIGIMLRDYNTFSESRLPFDVHAGVTVKPEFMPFRFTFTGYNLAYEDVVYFNTDEPDAEKPATIDKVLGRINIGAELLLSKNINLRFGYNHLVRRSLRMEEAAGGAGFSYGFMVKIKAFEVAYGRGGYHAAGGSNSFGITANTNVFYKKKKNNAQ